MRLSINKLRMQLNEVKSVWIFKIFLNMLLYRIKCHCVSFFTQWDCRWLTDSEFFIIDKQTKKKSLADLFVNTVNSNCISFILNLEERLLFLNLSHTCLISKGFLHHNRPYVDTRRWLSGPQEGFGRLASPADLAPSCPTRGMSKQWEISHFLCFFFCLFVLES